MIEERSSRTSRACSWRSRRSAAFRGTLEAVCAVYGVTLRGAHDASADALAAVEVARAIAARHPGVAELAPEGLHARQITWHASWAANFQAYLRRQGTPDAVVDGTWPLRAAVPA